MSAVCVCVYVCILKHAYVNLLDQICVRCQCLTVTHRGEDIFSLLTSLPQTKHPSMAPAERTLLCLDSKGEVEVVSRALLQKEEGTGEKNLLS